MVLDMLSRHGVCNGISRCIARVSGLKNVVLPTGVFHPNGGSVSRFWVASRFGVIPSSYSAKGGLFCCPFFRVKMAEYDALQREIEVLRCIVESSGSAGKRQVK